MIFDSKISLDFSGGIAISLEAELTHGRMIITSELIDGVGELLFEWRLEGDYVPQTWATEHWDLESCISEAISQTRLSVEYHEDLLSLLAWWRKRGRYWHSEGDVKC